MRTDVTGDGSQSRLAQDGPQGPEASAGSGTIEIDRDGPLADPDDHAVVGLVACVALAVDHAPGDMHEVARRNLEPLRATRAELDEEPAPDDVAIGVVTGMHVPARGLVSIVLDAPHPDSLVRERLEPRDTWRGRRFAAELAPPDHLRSFHATRSDGRPARQGPTAEPEAYCTVTSTTSGSPRAGLASAYSLSR